MARRDRASFVGRAAELAIVDGLFLDDPATSVVLVHGPGGVGKSAFLREVARRGERTGWTPFVIDGQDLPPCPDTLDDALARARLAERPLVLVDSYERMGALGPDLRRILPTLPDRTVVAVAGRAAPEPAWFEGGWEWLVRELPLGPLSPMDARTLLATHGVTSDDRQQADELARWAGGSPLVLTLAAAPGRTEVAVARAIVRRLIEREIERGLAADRIVLAGFSQGGAVVLHAGLTADSPVGGIVGLSTYLPSPELLQSADCIARDTPVLLAHGTLDQVIPLSIAEQSAGIIQAAGISVDWSTYPMGHEVCPDEIRTINAWLARFESR
jgi:dienelactone hydrolase